MEKCIHKSKTLTRKVSSLKQEIKKPFNSLETLDSGLPFPSNPCKGKHFLEDADELMPDPFDESGLASFHGAIHPLEPVDINLMRPIYVPVGKTNKDGKCSVKSPFLDNLLIRVPSIKPSPLSPSPELSPLEVRECILYSSLPHNGNVSPHSSINSLGVALLSVDWPHESTKTSVSRVSDSSGLSEDSNWINTTGGSHKPHKGNDLRWKAILAVQGRDGNLGMRHFRLLRRIGCGDIGSVYLSELCATQCFFAMKVMDKACLAGRKKLARAHTEREILQLLDHPFLPTLYGHFETDRFSCLVMECCPGGDLHALRQRQPGKYFSEYAARFYAAEVLVALEYLHMLGVVYRDLKPENVLVREDGHIMLSDFDLSLRCSVSPTLIRTSTLVSDPAKHVPTFCVQPSSCIGPTSASCIQPARFLPKTFLTKYKKKSVKDRTGPMKLELVAEPTAARSTSFVGTHEYLAPEIIKGEGHGNAVDWWTFGIFLHELLYGKTPFKGSGNQATLFNVVRQELKFPHSPPTGYASRDLIRGLLVKEPRKRLGVKRGASEIKQHPFFEGVNWALIRCSTPPEVPGEVVAEVAVRDGRFGPVGSRRIVGTDVKSGGKYLDFEFF